MREWEPGYVIGQNPDTGETTFVNEEDLLKHTVIIGDAQRGKTSLLMNLVAGHLSAGGSFSIFDSGGKLWDYGLAGLAQKRAENVALLDTEKEDRIVCFNPLQKKGLLSVPERTDRITKTIMESGWREGIPMSMYDSIDPIGGIMALLSSILEPSTYYYHSLAPKEGTIDFRDILQENTRFLAKVPRHRGSYTYGMLLFTEFLIAAERTPMSDLYLLFIDEAFSFLPASIVDILQQLTSNRIGLVITLTYRQLAHFKQRSPDLYNCLLTPDQFGIFMAFGADEDGPIDVIEDVASCLCQSER